MKGLHSDWWSKLNRVRSQLYAGYRLLPREQLESDTLLLHAAPEMADMLDDLINTLANYRILQKHTKDPVGTEVTTVQIQEIKALLAKAIGESA